MMMTHLMILELGLEPKAAISTGTAVALFTTIVGAAGYVATGLESFPSLPPLAVG